MAFNPYQSDIETLDPSSLEDFWSPNPPLSEAQKEKLRGNVGVPVFGIGTSEKESKNKKKAKKIYNACILDKGSDVDMTVSTIRKTVEETCEAIAEDPSWWQSWKYD